MKMIQTNLKISLKFKRKYFYFIFLSIFFFQSNLFAAESYIPGFSLFPPFQVPKENKPTISRVSIFYGKHDVVFWTDVGLIGNITNKEFIGAAFSGVFNYTKGKTYSPLQLAGLTNINLGETYIFGAQVALGLNSNSGKGAVGGLQIAALGNIAPLSKVYGAQVGLYNLAESVYGFQIGLINRTKSLHGLQIGLINLNASGPLKFFPVLNIGI